MTSKNIFSPEAHRGWLPWGLLSPFLCIAFVVASVLGTSPWMESLGLEDADGDAFGGDQLMVVTDFVNDLAEQNRGLGFLIV